MNYQEGVRLHLDGAVTTTETVKSKLLNYGFKLTGDESMTNSDMEVAEILQIAEAILRAQRGITSIKMRLARTLALISDRK